MLNATWYSQSMGQGKILKEDAPNIIEYPKQHAITGGYVLMAFACKNAK